MAAVDRRPAAADLDPLSGRVEHLQLSSVQIAPPRTLIVPSKFPAPNPPAFSGVFVTVNLSPSIVRFFVPLTFTIDSTTGNTIACPMSSPASGQ